MFEISSEYQGPIIRYTDAIYMGIGEIYKAIYSVAQNKQATGTPFSFYFHNGKTLVEKFVEAVLASLSWQDVLAWAQQADLYVTGTTHGYNTSNDPIQLIRNHLHVLLVASIESQVIISAAHMFVPSASTPIKHMKTDYGRWFGFDFAPIILIHGYKRSVDVNGAVTNTSVAYPSEHCVRIDTLNSVHEPIHLELIGLKLDVAPEPDLMHLMHADSIQVRKVLGIKSNKYFSSAWHELQELGVLELKSPGHVAHRECFY